MQPAAQSAATREAPRLESQLAALDKLASAYNSGRAAAAEAVAAGAALKMFSRDPLSRFTAWCAPTLASSAGLVAIAAIHWESPGLSRWGSWVH